MRNPLILVTLPLGIVAILTGGQAGALPDPSQVCDQAAHRAARTAGVPLDILLAIARVETGRDQGRGLQPWPWTVNVGGDGSFYDDAALALAQAAQVLDGGTENFDVGCFQLNYRWHGGAFPSLEAMFDPEANALYAANFLLTLYQSTGSWAQAIGQYHSQSGELAESYLSKVDALLGGGLAMEPGGSQLANHDPDLPLLRENNFPLLLAGASGQGGSLVPQTPSRGSLFAAAN